jgi:DNA-binding MarR family transcriptional regulator
MATVSNPASVKPLTPADPRIEAWSAYLRGGALLLRRLDEELQAQHGLSLAEYDVLVQLVAAPERRLRMGVLADRVVLSRSGITRLVKRLIAEGMVERTTCSSDARGAEARLTPVGLDRMRAASRTHLAGVQRHFVEPISDEDRAAIERASERILESLNADPLAN